MSEVTRPKRVVIVDADNPMEEIRGEFFWREDHERILAAERHLEYERGFKDGVAAAARTPRHVTVRVRHRPRIRLLVRVLLALIVVAYAITLVASFGR